MALRLSRRQEPSKRHLVAAQARREIRDDPDIELMLDMLTGPFYYRALFGRAPISRGMTGNVVEYALRVAVRSQAVA